MVLETAPVEVGGAAGPAGEAAAVARPRKPRKEDLSRFNSPITLDGDEGGWGGREERGETKTVGSVESFKFHSSTFFFHCCVGQPNLKKGQSKFSKGKQPKKRAKFTKCGLEKANLTNPDYFSVEVKIVA